MDVAIDLHSEYEAIINMYNNGEIEVPIQAFFGDLLERPNKRKAYPIILIDEKINIDQLLAINNAMKNPIAYIQGPPGTGKTNTIINTIVTAFFNEKTVLFTAYNNHPINSVFIKISGMKYKGKTIPFPVLRLGNIDKTREAIKYIKDLYEYTKSITIFDKTLDKNKDERSKKAKIISELLKKHEEYLNLSERSEIIKRVIDYETKENNLIQSIPFQFDLQGRQLKQVNEKMRENGDITEKEVFDLLDTDLEELKKYLYFISAKHIKRIDEPKNEELKNIIMLSDEEVQIKQFNNYISKKENINKLKRIFPIIMTTCISAHRLGEPEPMFDMVIMDEASQSNLAISLVPIVRGEKLMLVGDPQQLNPVILLDELTNQKLRKKYNIQDEYDYRNNSIYKTYLACDAVSDEVLLHYHYRCNSKIIEFNNKKYYNSKLMIKSDSRCQNPLIYFDVKNSVSNIKNTAPEEVREIINFVELNKDKSIGIITPFVNQKKLIDQALENKNIKNVTCGTVHAFQGDEKDVILFSTAITDQTLVSTYNWLKNNRELINVATSRAKNQLILLSNSENINRLHKENEEDDLYELIQYVKFNGQAVVTQKKSASRALGVKPFSTATEEAFLKNLSHAMENIWLSQNRFIIHKEVAISQVFRDNSNYSDLFYSGRFDFVVYEKNGTSEIPVLAIELDGKEHYDNEIVKRRDEKKNEICRIHNLQLIRVENSYARRYNHIKDILINYFEHMR